MNGGSRPRLAGNGTIPWAMSANDFYPTSGWGTILGARTDEDALGRLLTRYRRPIRLEIQSRLRCPLDEAEELTSQFIHNCLRRDFLKNIDPKKGRFRSFIKRCVVNFLRDRHRAAAVRPAQVSLEETDDEGRRRLDPAGAAPAPDAAVDIEWARQVLALAHQQLEQECVATRRVTLLVRLKPFLQGDPEDDSYAVVARDLGMTEPAVRTSSHRLRKRLGRIIKDEIGETVASEAELQDEVRYFLELLGHGAAAA